ncbi:hypothetical protein TKK_0011207 [Trichogramma kaykai]|uniref:Fucosyltransferase n=1 Tax=Trichogramma kaykai TaxID=54128 RepID=A0ABD2WVJ0_9HYME
MSELPLLHRASHRRRRRRRRPNCLQLIVWLAVFALAFLLTILVVYQDDFMDYSRRRPIAASTADMQQQQETISLERVGATERDQVWLKSRRLLANQTSPLGMWLLSEADGTRPLPPARNPNNGDKPFLIVVWKQGEFLERRHIRRFSDKFYSPWENCPVDNCELSYRDEDVDKADAVLFHLQRLEGRASLPTERRHPRQRWVFLTDESPPHTFPSSRGSAADLAEYDGLFNWSMSYRLSSDVPVPYGRTRFDRSGRLDEATLSAPGAKSKLVAILGSNCAASERWEYVRELQSLLRSDELDVLGRCNGANRTACPGHFETDCPALGRYKFYLAFENSRCREYLSEKTWWHGFAKGAVPVVMGPPRSELEPILPPDSFMHVDDFAGPSSLVDYMRYLSGQPGEIERRFHAWRKRGYRVLQEHGYFGAPSRHYCRLCHALNFNDPRPKVYLNMRKLGANDCAASPPILKHN